MASYDRGRNTNKAQEDLGLPPQMIGIWGQMKTLMILFQDWIRLSVLFDS